jgi:hypothetical protein
MAPEGPLPYSSAQAPPTTGRASARGSRHAGDQAVIDLTGTYRRLASPWTPEQLAARYRDAQHRRAAPPEDDTEPLRRPIAALAGAIPPSAALNVAIHVLHLLPQEPGVAQAHAGQELINTAAANAADALHRCHHALELDGHAHGYSAEDWLGTVYEIAARLLRTARQQDEPPKIVQDAQEQVSWLSLALLELDQDSPEAPTAITETLGRLLTLSVFAELAQPLSHQAER